MRKYPPFWAALVRRFSAPVVAITGTICILLGGPAAGIRIARIPGDRQSFRRRHRWDAVNLFRRKVLQQRLGQ